MGLACPCRLKFACPLDLRSTSPFFPCRPFSGAFLSSPEPNTSTKRPASSSSSARQDPSPPAPPPALLLQRARHERASAAGAPVPASALGTVIIAPLREGHCELPLHFFVLFSSIFVNVAACLLPLYIFFTLFSFLRCI